MTPPLPYTTWTQPEQEHSDVLAMLPPPLPEEEFDDYVSRVEDEVKEWIPRYWERSMRLAGRWCEYHRLHDNHEEKQARNRSDT